MPSELAALGRPHEVTATWGTLMLRPRARAPAPEGGSPRRPERSLPTLVSVRASGRGTMTRCAVPSLAGRAQGRPFPPATAGS